jgi:hypothetical protein
VANLPNITGRNTKAAAEESRAFGVKPQTNLDPGLTLTLALKPVYPERPTLAMSFRAKSRNLGPLGYRKGEDLAYPGVGRWDQGQCSLSDSANGARFLDFARNDSKRLLGMTVTKRLTMTVVVDGPCNRKGGEQIGRVCFRVRWEGCCLEGLTVGA